MGTFNGLEPWEWANLRSIFSCTLPHITTTKYEMDILLYLADLTIRRRQVKVAKTVRDMTREDPGTDHIALRAHNYTHLTRAFQALINSGKVIKINNPVKHPEYIINMVGILETYLKMVAYNGADISKYIGLLPKVKEIFPNNFILYPIHNERGMNLPTIESAIQEGLARKESKLKAKEFKTEVTVRDFYAYLNVVTKNHDMSLYPISGLKSDSIIRRFIKDCKGLGTTAYEVVDYVLDHYMELNAYSQKSKSFTLAISVFDFEKIYYNKEEILIWFLHTKERGFYDVDKSIIEQAGESIGIKVIPFKKRGKK